MVVVTRGDKGAFAVTRSLEVQRPAVLVELVDTVGAGDSFTSGLLDGLRRTDLIGGNATTRWPP
jgi:fructokinase